jgi:signal peptidase I
LKNPEVFGQDQLKELSRNLLTDNKIIRLRLGGYSMFPNLMPGDIATIRQVEPSLLKLGEIVVAEINGRWIAHRLVSKQETKSGTLFITQGDSVSRRDINVAKSDIIGLVEEIERGDTSVASSAFISWFYVSFRPLPQIAGRLVLKIKLRIGALD